MVFAIFAFKANFITMKALKHKLECILKIFTVWRTSDIFL